VPEGGIVCPAMNGTVGGFDSGALDRLDRVMGQHVAAGDPAGVVWAVAGRRGEAHVAVAGTAGEGGTGAAWLDDAGEDDVVVRLSRAVGLPPPAPDVFGLALRVPTAGGRYGDLLFASTGLGRLTRFTLTPAR